MSEQATTITQDTVIDRDHAESPWLVAPMWDTLWMFSGLWLLALLLIAQAGGKISGANHWMAVFGWALLWGAHIMGPIAGAWSRAELREDLLKNKTMYIAIPGGLFIVSCLLGVFAGEGAADAVPFLMVNYQFTGLGAAFMLFFIVWNIWHFSSQHFGVLSIYRVRKKQFDPEDRKFDRRFTLMLTGVLVPLAWYSQGRRWGSLFDVLPTVDPRGAFAIGIVIVSVAFTAYAIYFEMRKQNSSVPKAIYMLSIGIQPIVGVIAYSLYHFAVFSVAHWLVAIAIAARVSSNTIGAQEGLNRRPIFGLGRLFLVQVALLILMALPLYLLTRSSVIPAVHMALSGNGADSPGHMQLLGLIAGAGLGLSFIHFVYDRYIYSFHRPLIRKNISEPLFRQS